MNTENNKLIAEFLNYEPFHSNHYRCLVKLYEIDIVLPPQYMKFNSDWNWLMQVVEKIESLGAGIEIYNNYCKIIFDDEIIFEIEENSKIQSTYNACIEFIKWYNQNTQKNEK